ncbi:hypothetical protein, partial [Paraburkholderia sp. SIMBA_027]|uniref:hypothetical protein n=1 Tax=Paraburkholderia sp. SIMBA_027 TaxID=3085770 RepID=UPI00397E3E5B
GDYGGGSSSNTPNNSNTEPCSSIKSAQADTKYIAKFDSLNKKSVFEMDKERGFYEIQPPKGTPASSGFVQIDGPPGSTGLHLPDNTNRIS